MATERTFPLFGPLSRIRPRDGHQLGQQFRGWFDVFAHDALLEPHMDICRIRRDLHPGLGRGVVHLSGNERVAVRRCEGAFTRWMGRGGEFEEEKVSEGGFHMRGRDGACWGIRASQNTSSIYQSSHDFFPQQQVK